MTDGPTQITPGCSYTQESPTAWPAYMQGARITVTTIFPGEGLTVAYEFESVSGVTGAGTMRMDYARAFLKPIQANTRSN